MLDWTTWPLLQTKQEYNGLQDVTETEERTAWLRLWGHKQGEPRKTHILYNITESLPGFLLLSALSFL